MSRKKRGKKKHKNNGVYCKNIISKKIILTPLEYNILCNKCIIGKNEVEFFN